MALELKIPHPAGDTTLAVRWQLRAVGAKEYELWAIHGETGAVHFHRHLSAAGVEKLIRWAKAKNKNGCNIFFRPERDLPHELVFLDLDRGGWEAVERVRAAGLEPAVVVESSPGRYQLWIRLRSEPPFLPPAQRTAVAKVLAERYGGDVGSADYMHLGRLAGFVNPKPERAVDGQQPFALLREYAGRTADTGAAEKVRKAALGRFAQQIAHGHEDQRSESRSERNSRPGQGVGPGQNRPESTLPEQDRALSEAARDMPGGRELDVDPVALEKWYTGTCIKLRKRFGDEFDPSRADWRAAVMMFARGHDFQTIRDTIEAASPDVEQRKRGHLHHYAALTAARAEVWNDWKHTEKPGGGRHAYEEVAHLILQEARRRHPEIGRGAAHKPPLSSCTTSTEG